MSRHLLAAALMGLVVASLVAAQSTKSQQAARQQPRPAASKSPPAPKRPQQVAQAPQAPQEQQQLDYGNERSPQAEENSQTDSEPALYGSVAGQPGVDFPNYQRVPKTSFTCEGKGFDFGFYADEEAQCQAYHVCWEGRRESFLCGVGTVFNQAILACDYWHSVDCSKSSQFWGVNSELGKAGAEPAAQKPARQQQQLPPVSSSSSALAGNQAPARPAARPPAPGNLNAAAGFAAQRNSPAPTTAYDYGKPARAQQQQESGKTQPARQQQLQAPTSTSTSTTLATPPAAAAVKRRPSSFNMDLNQKVHSLIESPVRPPIKSSAARRQQPAKQQQQPANFAQAAVARAQQTGSQTLSGRPAKSSAKAQFQQQQQQKQGYEADLEQVEPQQQQAFDDSPVQTSQQQQPQQFNQERLPEAPQLVVRAGGSGDGSSAITSQYDTYNNQPQLQQLELNSNYEPSQQQQQQQQQQQDDLGGQSDDFRSAGAKAAASHNQNWYIMRTI